MPPGQNKQVAAVIQSFDRAVGNWLARTVDDRDSRPRLDGDAPRTHVVAGGSAITLGE
jgi:hypothetical protein